MTQSMCIRSNFGVDSAPPVSGIPYLKPRFAVIVCSLVLFWLPRAFAQPQSTTPGIAVASIGAGIRGGVPGSSDKGTGSNVLPELFTGSATSVVPILLPQGRNGLAPLLNVTYRSGNGNGWLGMGWDLNPGVIERSMRNGVSYQDDDFTLRTDSGIAELVNIGNSEYRMKIEADFIRIRQLKSVANKAYWEVTDKNGSIFLFGETDNALETDQQGQIFRWRLSRLQDTSGNYITYTYSTPSDGVSYLREVKYAGNQNLDPSIRVVFYVEDRPDKQWLYDTRYPRRQNFRLRALCVFAGNDNLRAYEFTYSRSEASGRSTLSALEEIAGDFLIDTQGTIAGGEKRKTAALEWSNPSPLFKPTQFAVGDVWGGFRNDWVDVNGDGKADYCRVMGNTNSFLDCRLSTGDSLGPEIKSGVMDLGFEEGRAWVDVTGNHQAAYCRMIGSKESGFFASCLPFTGSGFGSELVLGPVENYQDSSARVWLDVDGDGKADYCRIITHIEPVFPPKITSTLKCSLSNGRAFGSEIESGPIDPGFLEGRAWVHITADKRLSFCRLGGSKETGFVGMCLPATSAGFGAEVIFGGLENYELSSNRAWIDVNNDNIADYCRLIRHQTSTFPPRVFNTAKCSLSSVGGVGAEIESEPIDIGFEDGRAWVDVTSTGRPGFCRLVGAKETTFNVECLPVLDAGFGADFLSSPIENYLSSSARAWVDINGDGKPDYCRLVYANSYSTATCTTTNVTFPDLLASVGNEFGGKVRMEYSPSSGYRNLFLPFVIPTLRSLTVTDGVGASSSQVFDYERGLYDIVTREFRGFGHVTETGPVSEPKAAGSISRITDSWFHQGQETEPHDDDPAVKDAFMKGKLYRSRISDSAGKIYSESLTRYGTDPPSPPSQSAVTYHFNPPVESRVLSCEGAPCVEVSKTELVYDRLGNVTTEKHTGQIEPFTIIRTFEPNVSTWVLAMPATEETLGGPTLSRMSMTSFYYDGLNDCSKGSGSPMPTKGRLTRIVRWVEKGDSPETILVYDDYGNLTCTRDPAGHITKYFYDSSASYRLGTLNARNQTVRMTYYGVDGDHNHGPYGMLRTTTDPNKATTTRTYDAFARLKRTEEPDGGWTEYTYSDFGQPGRQNVRTVNAIGLEARTYLDGLGRSVKDVSTGPNHRMVVVDTTYEETGSIAKSSLPHFEGDDPKWNTFTYDPIGRPRERRSVDGATKKYCYGTQLSVVVDENARWIRRTADANGHIIRVEEFGGANKECSPVPPDSTPKLFVYATTTYRYDALGRLIGVTDAKNNKTEITYDALGRKLTLKDGDTGLSTYDYNAAGKVKSQVDALKHRISFEYDELNRVVKKIRSGNGQVTYTYDSGNPNSVGRLSAIADTSSGYQERFYYDSVGRIVESLKTIHAQKYRVQIRYDLAGRTDVISYPGSGDLVQYSYDGPFVGRVFDKNNTYVIFSSYRADGRPQSIQFGNNVVTHYGFSGDVGSACSSASERLCQARTVGPDDGELQNDTYNYDDTGNIVGVATPKKQSLYIYDDLKRLIAVGEAPIDAKVTTVFEDLRATPPEVLLKKLVEMEPNVAWKHTYGYDEIGNMVWNSKLGAYHYPEAGDSSAGPHAVKTAGKLAFTYFVTGAMKSGNGRTLTYDGENRLTGIIRGNDTTQFIYDPDGNRVEKIVNGHSTTYVGKLYECTDGVCTRFISIPGLLIASVRDNTTAVTYYHPDRLGSTVATTDSSGKKLDELRYGPFGDDESTKVSASITRRYTGQSLDLSTGLYYYQSRYYDPLVGRFTSTDPTVALPGAPQNLNRYSYVSNNPVNATDPDGHMAWFVPIVIGAVMGGVQAALHHDDVLFGMGAGAFYGAMFSMAEGAGGGLLASTAAGGASGAANAAMRHGDIAGGAILGSFFALASAGISRGGEMSIFGSSTSGSLAGTANYIANSAVHGALLGGAYGALMGRDPSEAMATGAMQGAMGASLSVVIGRSIGALTKDKGTSAEWRSDSQLHLGATTYSVKGWTPFTVGNVVIGDLEGLDNYVTLGDPKQFETYTVFQHELGHVLQGETLGGFGYFPAHALSWLGGFAAGVVDGEKFDFSDMIHRHGLMERYYHNTPQY